MQILHDPVLQALIIVLIFVLLGLTACAMALILQAYWNHFMHVATHYFIKVARTTLGLGWR